MSTDNRAETPYLSEALNIYNDVASSVECDRRALAAVVEMVARRAVEAERTRLRPLVEQAVEVLERAFPVR